MILLKVIFSLLLIKHGVILANFPVTCPVGILGEYATTVACDAQQIYCKLEYIPYNNYTYGSCASRCINGIANVNCYLPGFDIDNAGTSCLIGDLYGGVGAIPARCPTNFNYCKNNRTINGNLTTANVGTCADRCTPILAGASPTTTVQCYTGELSNKLGPLCYVGTFGVNAAVAGCPENYLCQYNPIGYTGSCVQTCTSLSTCTNTDLLNKQGPVCYVGQFSVNAKAVACLSNQICQSAIVQNIVAGQYTLGSCVTSCLVSSITNCCNTDLCNSYKLPSQFNSINGISSNGIYNDSKVVLSNNLNLIVLFSLYLFRFLTNKN